jgi:hypothetical protein
MSFTTFGCRAYAAAADDGVEDLDQVQHVLVDLAAGRLAQVEEVEQLDLEVMPWRRIMMLSSWMSP